MSHALATRRARVSARFADVIHWIQSRRATGVMSDQTARAAAAPASARRRSAGTRGSGSSAEGTISIVTRSPTAAPAASRNARVTFNQ